MRKFLFSLALIATATTAQGNTSGTTDWKEVGRGTHSMLLLKVYDAVLKTPTGAYTSNSPIDLTITYRVSVSGTKLAKRTIEEMENTACKHPNKYADWQANMNKVFPDVKNGYAIRGVAQKDSITFYGNGTKTGTIKGADFRQCFLNVWLSPKTSAPELRKKLLGL